MLPWQTSQTPKVSLSTFSRVSSRTAISSTTQSSPQASKQTSFSGSGAVSTQVLKLRRFSSTLDRICENTLFSIMRLAFNQNTCEGDVTSSQGYPFVLIIKQIFI